MSNTVIQLKYSNVTGTPPSLNVAEPAYSTVSNKLWIGDGSSVIAIGGKHYTDQIDAATSEATGNTLVLRTTSGNFDANVVVANTFIANTAVIQNGYDLYAFANNAYTMANNAMIAGGQIAGSYANSAYLHANSAYLNSNSAYIHANSAYDFANTRFASAGGTITGDVVVNANLTVSGTTTYVNTQTILVGDNILTLNADIPASLQPTENGGIEISRGLQPNASLLWIESVGKWTANNGNNSFYLASDAAESYANSAYLTANVASQQAITSGSYANSAFAVANTDVTTISTTAGIFGSESIVPVFNISANGRVYSVTNTTISIGASQVTSGVLPVVRGGTGNTEFTLNHVLLGNGTNAIATTGSSTEGHILTINSSGVPTFQFLSGGTF